MNNHTAARDSKRALAFLLSAVMVAAMFFAAMPQNAYAEEGAGPATDASVIPATEPESTEGVVASDPSPIVSAEESDSGEEVTALENDNQQDVITLKFTDSGTATIYNKWTTPVIVNGGDQINENVAEDTSIDVIVSVNDVVTITESANDTFREWESVDDAPLVENVYCELTAIPAMNVFTEDVAGTTAGDYFFLFFNLAGALTSLPVGSFNTSDITTVGELFFCGFNNVGALTSLPAGSFDTSGITTVGDEAFFSGFNCGGDLTSLPAGSFDTSNIDTAGERFFAYFNSGGALESLPEGSFNISNITSAGDEFFCDFNSSGALESLPEESFNTSNINTVGNSFFSGFNSSGALTSLPEESFNTSNINTVDNGFFRGFNSFGALTSLPEGSFETSKITTANYYFFSNFNSSGALESLPGGSFDTSGIIDVGSNFFEGFNSHGTLKSLPSGSFDTSGISDANYYFFSDFNSYGALTSLPEGSFDTSKITTVGQCFFSYFNESGALTSLPEGSFDTSGITAVGWNFFCLFNSFGALTSLPAGSFDTSRITNVYPHFSFGTYNFFKGFNTGGALTQGNKGVMITNNSNQTITDFSSGTNLPGTISTGGGKAYINASYIPAPTKYTVTFNANGGSNVAGREVTAGAAIGALPQAARTGYTFKGWYTAAAGGTKIEASALVTAAVTYFAQWTANSYTVTHNVNGGKALSSKAKTKTVKYDSAYGELAKTTRDGYTFKGWYTAKSGGTKITNTTKVQTAKDHTLHAQWTAKTFTATFNANGGKVSPVGGGSKAKTTKMKVTYAQKFGKLPVPTRAGYKFAGWYTAKSGGTKITKTSTVKITKNTTYYARWTKK